MTEKIAESGKLQFVAALLKRMIGQDCDKLMVFEN